MTSASLVCLVAVLLAPVTRVRGPSWPMAAEASDARAVREAPRAAAAVAVPEDRRVAGANEVAGPEDRRVAGANEVAVPEDRRAAPRPRVVEPPGPGWPSASVDPTAPAVRAWRAGSRGR